MKWTVPTTIRDLKCVNGNLTKEMRSSTYRGKDYPFDQICKNIRSILGSTVRFAFIDHLARKKGFLCNILDSSKTTQKSSENHQLSVWLVILIHCLSNCSACTLGDLRLKDYSTAVSAEWYCRHNAPPVFTQHCHGNPSSTLSLSWEK